MFIIVDKKLQDFTIAIGNKIDSCDSFDPENFTICAYISESLGSSEKRHIDCNNPVQGRFVAIYFTRPAILTLCEVEVYGRKVSGKYTRSLWGTVIISNVNI